MMQSEVKKYRNYKNSIKFMLVASGVWPTYYKHSTNQRRFLSACSLFASGFTFYCIVSFCIKNIENINIFVGGLGMVIAFFTLFFKVCILILNENDLRHLNKGISAKFETDLQVCELRPHLLAHFQIFYKLFYLYKIVIFISVTLLLIIPLLTLGVNKYIRVYPQHLPFHYEPGGLIHWTLYGFEILCGFYLYTLTCGVDSVFGLYALHMVGELRVLGVNFQNLRSSRNYDRDLKKCIDRHRLLIKSRCQLEQVFSFLALWLIISCAIAMCAVVFQATQSKNKSFAKLSYLTSHFILKLIQAYSYAWYGNIIAVESETCLNSMYNAQWAGSGNIRFMKDVLIILSQKPQIFKVKGWLAVRLIMFVKILHAALSYFFVIIHFSKPD